MGRNPPSRRGGRDPYDPDDTGYDPNTAPTGGVHADIEPPDDPTSDLPPAEQRRRRRERGGGPPTQEGRRGGGGGRRGPPSYEDEGNDIEDLIKQNFSDILSGKLKRYSPELMAQMKQGIFKSTIGAKRGRELEAMRQSAVAGSFRSATLQRRLQDIGTSARAQYASGIQKLMFEAAKAEWEDRQVALGQAQNWLNAKRQYILGKKQIAATLEAARISAGATVAAARLGKEATLGAARIGAAAAREQMNLNFEMWEAEFTWRENNFGG